ncbi:MAG: alpha/beta fold hydrolase [Thermoleophilia bacterium]
MCLHGFTDTWRTWELVLPALERRHEVLAPALAGHAGGPPLPARVDAATLPDAVERAMDAAGLDAAHLVGNSLGGYVALRLAERGRALSVTALAPAGGWARDDHSYRDVLAGFVARHRGQIASAARADAVVSTPERRRAATRLYVVNHEHLPAELLAHQLVGAARCAVEPLVECALREGYPLEPAAIACPVRVVWGRDDLILPWPATARRYLDEALPQADWVELDGVGHCPQLDVPTETAQLVLDFTAR